MVNEKISVYQFLLIVSLFTIGTSILTLPQGMAATAKQDGWIATSVSILLGILVVWLFNAVSNLYPNLTIVELNEKVFGKWIGSIISVLFVFFHLKNASAATYFVGQFITIYVMPETPIQIIMVLVALVVVMGMRLGLEVLARAAEILFPWFAVLFLILVLSISPQIKLENIQPILENGIKPITKAILNMTATSYLPMTALLMFYPSRVMNPNKAKKAFWGGTVIGGMVMSILTFLTVAVLGHETTTRTFYVTYILAKEINIGNFLQRIEAIIAAMFFISMYFKLTFYFYSCTVGLAKVLNLKDYRPLVTPMIVILVVFGLVQYPNVIYQSKWDSTIWIPYALTMGFFYPVLLLVIGKIKIKLKGIRNP